MGKGYKAAFCLSATKVQNLVYVRSVFGCASVLDPRRKGFAPKGQRRKGLHNLAKFKFALSFDYEVAKGCFLVYESVDCVCHVLNIYFFFPKEHDERLKILNEIVTMSLDYADDHHLLSISFKKFLVVSVKACFVKIGLVFSL